MKTEIEKYWKSFGEMPEYKKERNKVFESRYDSKIMDSEKIYLEKLNYIHNNPCAKGWNSSPAQSPERDCAVFA
jgi:hypothetical protein